MHSLPPHKFCSWPALTKGSQCVGCGYALKKDYAAAPKRSCRKPGDPVVIGTSTGCCSPPDDILNAEWRRKRGG